MRINLLLKISLVALVLLGLSLRSAVSAGGSDEEVFPPKTLEKLKKNYSTEQKKLQSERAAKSSDKSSITFGLIKINISTFLSFNTVVPKSLPRPGNSPKKGMFSFL